MCDRDSERLSCERERMCEQSVKQREHSARREEPSNMYV